MRRSILFVFIFSMMCAAGIFAATAAKKPMTTKPATAAAAKTPVNHGIFSADSLQWSNAPAVLPAGAMLAVMEGNPSKAGPYTMRLKMPANYKIQPHYHPGIEHVTVISGTLKIGMGDKFDESTMTEMKASTFGFIAPRAHHYAMATEDTILQLHGTGPWKLIYLNPADDPSKMHK